MILLILLTVGLSPSAKGAQPAETTFDHVPVYDKLLPGAKILQYLNLGERVAAGNEPVQGFYKVRTLKGYIGWVEKGNLKTLERPTPEQLEEMQEKRRKLELEAIKNSQKEDPLFGVRKDANGVEYEKIAPDNRLRRGLKRNMITVFYGGDGYSLNAIRNLTGEDIPNFGTHIGAEWHFLLTPTAWPIIFRMEFMRSSNIVRNSSTLTVLSTQVSAQPMYIGTRFDLMEKNGFSSDISVFGGVSFGQAFKASVLTLSEPNVTEMSANSLAALLKTNFNYAFADFWFATIELGYRFMRSPLSSYKTSSSNNGSSFFVRDGSLKPVSIDLSGFTASFGISAQF